MNVGVRALIAALVIASAPHPVAAQTTAPERPSSTPVAASSSPAPSPSADSRRERRWKTPVRPVRLNALLYYPASALGRGLTLGYERTMPNPRFTVLVRASASFPAGRDFRSVDLEGSLEARYYALARGPFTRWQARAAVGLYVGLRIGLFHSRLVDRRDDRLVGTLNRLVTEVSAGYRFTIAGRVEITPFLGALFYADFIANLPPSLRPNLSAGATVGVLF